MKKKLTVTILYILMILIAISMVFPFLWTFLASVKTQAENISTTFQLLPEGNILSWHWQNYTEAMDAMNFGQSFKNTIFILVPKMFGDVVVSALVAYGFARFDFPYKTQIFLVLLATLMIPFEVTMIPLYIVYAQIGWINTFLPLIAPALIGGASQFIFFLTMYFITIPEDLVSAARVDGLNDFEIFSKIYLPISVPAIVVVAIWSFQGTWNDLLGPLIWLQSSDKFTLQLALASIANTTTYQVDQGVILAGTVLVMLPILILFLFLQGYILDSAKSSGIKG